VAARDGLGVAVDQLHLRIRAVLTERPGLTAKEIAAAVRAPGSRALVQRGDINPVLYRHRTVYRNDGGYVPRWYLIESTPVVQSRLLDAVQRVDGSLVSRLWQREALHVWASNGGRGVVQAVTGAGKTHVGLGAAVAGLSLGHRVAVVVPTIDLQAQWYRALQESLAPRGYSVGRLGGGHDDSLEDDDALVAVMASGSRKWLLPPGQPGVLVADECHHLAAENLSLNLEDDFAFRLGLTCDFDSAAVGVGQRLVPYFGDVLVDYGYERAIAEGTISRFKIAFVGARSSSVGLTDYARLEHRVAETLRRLLGAVELEPEPFWPFLQMVRRLDRDSSHPAQPYARAYLRALHRKWRWLDVQEVKLSVLADLRPAIWRARSTIIFTQTTCVARRVVERLAMYEIAAEYISGDTPKRTREAILSAFRNGTCRVLVAPRVLDEGVDVPSADLAVVVNASRSPRQMIQRMGRVLRANENSDGRLARLVVIYVEGTSEDPAYGGHHSFIERVVAGAHDQQMFAADRSSAEVCAYVNDWHAR
jgi:superfamily II DNA or RNA helicase